jgi:hypothetical protein
MLDSFGLKESRYITKLVYVGQVGATGLAKPLVSTLTHFGGSRFANMPERYISWLMKHASPRSREEKVEETAGVLERGYAAWKRAKIERGLAQAQDRAAMIPVEQVLEDLKLAR